MKIKNNYLNKMVADGVLLFVAFFVVYYVKQGDVVFAPSYYSYLAVYFSGWLFSTLVTGKFVDRGGMTYFGRLRPFVISAVIFLSVISIALYALKWKKQRGHILNINY